MGDYRIIHAVDDTARIAIVTRVRHRKAAYGDLDRLDLAATIDTIRMLVVYLIWAQPSAARSRLLAGCMACWIGGSDCQLPSIIYKYRQIAAAGKRHMSDIFISYASENRTQAESIAKMLSHVGGWSVWWDREIPLGKTFDRVIEEELHRAKCVIVLWSQEAVKSEWILDEASIGRDRRVLVPVILQRVAIPFGFQRLQTADFTDWTGDRSSPEFKRLTKRVSAILDQDSETRSIEERKSNIIIEPNGLIEIDERKSIFRGRLPKTANTLSYGLPFTVVASFSLLWMPFVFAIMALASYLGYIPHSDSGVIAGVSFAIFIAFSLISMFLWYVRNDYSIRDLAVIGSTGAGLLMLWYAVMFPGEYFTDYAILYGIMGCFALFIPFLAHLIVSKLRRVNSFN